MKILFVENRYKTFFWEAIANELIKSGHKISWIVQNQSFIPKCGEVYKIPYPKKKDLTKNYDLNLHDTFEYIKSTDRLVNHFNKSYEHYFYYYLMLSKIIKKTEPDVVFGESTLFHELMVIDICKRLKIPYLNPSSSSYPPGRFSFYSYDTKTPLYGSNEKISNEEYDTLIETITTRKVIPDYMREDERKKKEYLKAGSIRNRLDILLSYLTGEKYNTPSPIDKFFKDKKTEKILKKWNKTGLKDIESLKTEKVVLYPLQMQPEANLDVWGNRYKNQALLVKELAQHLPDKWLLAVKPNPKSKYEMTEELLEAVNKSHNIVGLHSDISMKHIFNIAEIIVTVTGTVAIECILGEKPLGLMGPSITEGIKGCRKLNSPEEISALVHEVTKKDFKIATQNDKRELIKKLIETTYRGLISDPMSSAECMSSDNVRLIAGYIESLPLKGKG